MREGDRSGLSLALVLLKRSLRTGSREGYLFLILTLREEGHSRNLHVFKAMELCRLQYNLINARFGIGTIFQFSVTRTAIRRKALLEIVF